MAQFVVTYFSASYQWWPAVLDNDGAADIVAVSEDKLWFVSNAGFRVVLDGTGLQTVGGLAGTVTSLTVRTLPATHSAVLMITDLSVPLASLYDRLFGQEGVTDPDPLAALQLMLSGNDSIKGSQHSDQIGAFSAGDDRVAASRGDDFVAADPGNDFLTGGWGYDILSAYFSFYDPTASLGVYLDAAKGVMTDPWGGHDTFEGFESYEGSKLADVLKGSDKAGLIEQFRGFSGNDTIDGRGGWDRVVYTNDLFYSGDKGIQANLLTGRIRDPWGDIDKISNVEGVFGTAGHDSFVGDATDNEFGGLDDVDRFEGGGGSDWLSFWMNDSHGGLNGVEANLSKAHGQVLDDGYGNGETALSFENIIGSAFGDSLNGNRHPNKIYGERGDDVLFGRSGDDRLYGSGGDDTIDGGSGNDRLYAGGGQDTLTYAGANAGVDVSLAKETIQKTGGSGAELISSFENLLGSAFSDELTGTHRANLIDGAAGNDTITGNGGSDILRGAAGNDTLIVDSIWFGSVSGGIGIDTLAIEGAKQTLRLTNPAVADKISEIERVDLTGRGHNSLILNQAAVLNEVPADGGRHVFTVLGNASDTVSLADLGWTLEDTITRGDVVYDRWILGEAEVRIQETIDVVLLSP